MKFRMKFFVRMAVLAAVLVMSSSASPNAGPPLPSSFVALGDSITTAWGSGTGSAGSNVAGDNLPSSWATGSDPVVDSQLLRLQQAGATVTASENEAVPGSKVGGPTGLLVQSQTVPTTADYVLIEAGSSDLCADTTITPADQFKASVEQALQNITQRAPNAKVFVGSIPNWYQLWVDTPDTSRPGTCPLLFSTDPAVANDTTRQAVAQATSDYDDALASACAEFPACKYDGGAIHAIHLALDDLSSVDHFHPARAGQAKIAAAAWASGWFSDIQTPTIEQFGSTSPGTSSGAAPAGFKLGSIFTLDKDATPIDLGFYTPAVTAGQSFVPVVYDTVAGQPTDLVLQGAPVIVGPGQAAGWVRAPLPSDTLPAGTYLLGLLTGPEDSGATVGLDSSASAGFYNQNPFPTPTQSWGDENQSDQLFGFFLDYTAATSPDVVPPVISVPGTINVTAATGASGASVSYQVTATDDVDGSVAVDCAPASGSTFAVGTSPVACSASDSAGNTAHASFLVIVSAAPTGTSGQGGTAPASTTTTTTTTTTPVSAPSTSTTPAPFVPPATARLSVRIRHSWVSPKGAVWLSVAAKGASKWAIVVDGKRKAVSASRGFGRTGQLASGRHTIFVELLDKKLKTLRPNVASTKLRVTIEPR